MSHIITKTGKDDTRIGEEAAKQPLSGTHVVTTLRIKGVNNSSFVRVEETKKAS